MPRIEQMRHGARRVAARIGRIPAGITARTHIRLVPRQPALLLFPLALALAAVTILLAAQSGPGCTPTRQVAAPTAHGIPRTTLCRPATTLNTLYGH